MAPFEPLEDQEWAVIGGCVKKYRFTPPVSRSNTHWRWQDRRSHHLPRSRLYQLFPIKSFSYDKSDPVVKGHSSATGDSDIRRMSILEAYPLIPLSVVANWLAKMRTTLGPEINIAFRVGQTSAM
jgi:hypothetical protein